MELLKATVAKRSQDAGPAEQAAWLTRGGTVAALPGGGLERMLGLGRPLRVKLGLDPTAPDIHLGHSVVLGRLRDFQDLGHEVVLILGDFTARVGDPSGRSKTRPVLTEEQIESAARTYGEQAFQILDPSKTELRRNSEWLDMGMGELFALLRSTTVARILERDDFHQRLRAGTPISMLELLYPLIQGFDSVAVKADVELGGSDQTFNLLLARDIQRHYHVCEQVCLTMPILTGLDGTQKMSKSLGNYIGVSEPATEIYGKTMSIPDALLGEWETLLFGHDEPVGDPYARKRRLAASLTERFAGTGDGARAAAEFDAVFARGELPSDIPSLTLTPGELVHIPAVIADAFGISRAQARRDLHAGAVKLDGIKLDGGELDVPRGQLAGVLSLGKRRFCRLHT